MPEGWVSLPRPRRHATWVHYDHNVELRVRPIGGERFEVALMRRAGPLFTTGRSDLFVKVVRGMEAAAAKARWVMNHVEDLLTDEDEEREALRE